MKQKTRNEINDCYKADLSNIYESCDKWYQDVENFKNDVKYISKYKGIITRSENDFYEYLTTYTNLYRKLEKIYIYAHLKNDFDTSIPEYQKMYGIACKLIADFDLLNSYANPEILNTDYNIILKYLSSPKLEEYKHFIENIYRYKPHFLTESEETILSSLSNVLLDIKKTYETLIATDISFDNIEDEFKNKIELSSSNYSKYIKSKDRKVRKDAFLTLYKTYEKYKNTIASLFSTYIKTSVELSKIRKFSSSIESSLFSDNVSLDIYNNLITTVNENLDVLYKYYDLKKDVLNLDEMHIYDEGVELCDDDKTYSYEEAKKIIIDALSVLGDDYISIINKAFDERWIDVYSNLYKVPYCYSCGVYDTNPYILLNYEDKITDLLSLAHELGHSVHSYYSIKNNTYPNYEYTIFVAEVASLVNELLVLFYLLKKSNNDKEKMYILSLLMDLFNATLFRQTMFAEFEKDLHNMCEKGEILTSEAICDKYYKLNLKYHPKDMVVDKSISYEWERVTHFFEDFYVYKYAIGISCACYIVDGILNNKKDSLENYLKFLSLGGSDYPVNELKTTQIDVTDKEVIKSAINMFDNIINDFKKLYKNNK